MRRPALARAVESRPGPLGCARQRRGAERQMQKSVVGPRKHAARSHAPRACTEQASGYSFRALCFSRRVARRCCCLLRFGES